MKPAGSWKETPVDLDKHTALRVNACMLSLVGWEVADRLEVILLGSVCVFVWSFILRSIGLGIFRPTAELVFAVGVSGVFMHVVLRDNNSIKLFFFFPSTLSFASTFWSSSFQSCCTSLYLRACACVCAVCRCVHVFFYFRKYVWKQKWVYFKRTEMLNKI